MTERRFPWAKTFTLGFGFFGISVIWPLFNSLIPPMLEDLGLSALITGFILTWDNIINMFVQPWVGNRSDRTRSRFGRRKPWLMLGAPLAASSANRHGEPSPTTCTQAVASIGDACAIALDAGPSPAGLDSTVIGLAGPGAPTILREGAIDRATVARILGLREIRVLRSVRP